MFPKGDAGLRSSWTTQPYVCVTLNPPFHDGRALGTKIGPGYAEAASEFQAHSTAVEDLLTWRIASDLTKSFEGLNASTTHSLVLLSIIIPCQVAGGLLSARPSALTRARRTTREEQRRPQPMATRRPRTRLTREREHGRGAFIGRHS